MNAGDLPTPEEVDAKRLESRAAYFGRRDLGEEYRPAEREAFDAGWAAAMYFAYPRRYVLGPGANLIDDTRLIDQGPLMVIPSPRPRFDAEQLRGLGERVMHAAGPLDATLSTGIYIRNEVMHELGRALLALADEDGGS